MPLPRLKAGVGDSDTHSKPPTEYETGVMGVKERRNKTRTRRRRRLEVDSSLIEELLFGGPDMDSRRSTARLGASLYIAIGLVILATMWSLPERNAPRTYLLILVAESLAVGLIIPRLPWERWSPKAYVNFIVIGFLMLGATNYFIPGVPNPYDLLYVVLFAFIGLTQPPGTGLLMFPVAGASYVVPEVMSGSTYEIAFISIAVSAPIWVLIGEVLSRSTTRLQRAEKGAGRLLEAGTTLARATSEQETAALVTGFTVELLEADSVVVMVASDPTSSRLVNLGQHNFIIPIGETTVDPGTDPWRRILQDGDPLLLANARSSPFVPQLFIQNMNAQSLFFLPLLDEEGPQGLVVVGWSSKRSRLDRLSQKAAELISSEAGLVLGRIRGERRLAQDAETDALTTLYNRRFYARALDAMQPGDSVVLVDLDHFKQINDNYGHTVGDEVLRQLAECMKQAARRNDIVARYGGEEFAMVLADAGQKGATTMLERLRELWEDTHPLTTFSAGLAVHTADDLPATTVTSRPHALPGQGTGTQPHRGSRPRTRRCRPSRTFRRHRRERSASPPRSTTERTGSAPSSPQLPVLLLRRLHHHLHPRPP